MKSEPAILQIAVKTPLRRTFDYLSGENKCAWHPGQRVKIPFGRRELIGVIVGLAEKSAFPANKLKSVAAVVDENALLNEKLLSLYHWASDYYQHPIGDVILGTLPKKIREGQVGDADHSFCVASDEIKNVNSAFELTQEQKQ